MQGFHDDTGQLWTPGNLTFLDSEFLAIEQMMAIEKVKYSQSRHRGSLTHLFLCDPQALGGGAGGAGGFGGFSGNSTNKGWSMGGD